MAHSQTKSIDHELIAIFFLVRILHELSNVINPRNTLIWPKYEYGKVCLTKKLTHFMNGADIFQRFCVIFQWKEASYEPIFTPQPLRAVGGIVFTHGVRVGGWAGGGK